MRTSSNTVSLGRWCLSARLVTRPFERERKGKLEHKLNRNGKAGYRVVAGSSTDTLLVLEREARPATCHAYRTFSTRTPYWLSALEESTREGYSFVTMLVEAGKTLVLLERPGACPGRG